MNGLKLPKGLASADATPSVLRLYDPSMKEWLVGSAKLRAILSTFPVVPIGELPSWNMSLDGAGERTDLQQQVPVAKEAAQPQAAQQ